MGGNDIACKQESASCEPTSDCKDHFQEVERLRACIGLWFRSKACKALCGVSLYFDASREMDLDKSAVVFERILRRNMRRLLYSEHRQAQCLPRVML
jgi:hypothetical protein